MMANGLGKTATRQYRTDTFRIYQEEKVAVRELAVHDNLVLLGRSRLAFDNITTLADHVCEMLRKDGDPCHRTTLLRSHNRKDAKAPNPYRLLLEKYMIGKYFGKGKNTAITEVDAAQLRKESPAMDALCSLKDGEIKNLQEEVKLLRCEVTRLNGSKVLPQDAASASASAQLDKTLTAIKRLLDITRDFLEVDWERRAIIDISPITPEVVVEPELLDAFFMALEKSGMKPPEEK